VNHKAIYDFDLASISANAEISGVSGRLYYEQDDTCDAWTSEHRFSVQYQYPERPSIASNSHYVAWESKDFSQFYFNSTRQGLVSEQLRGKVIPHTDGTGIAEYTRPE